MLYLLHGKSQDRKDAITQKARSLGITPQHIHHDDLEERSIEDIVSIQSGLFGDTEMYVLHDLARVLELKKILPGYVDSEHHIIFTEKTITKPIRVQFEDSQAVIKDFGTEEKKKEASFNMFSLTDAFGNRDKKQLWLLFQEAQKYGSPEEIHGILFWQIKNLALVKMSTGNPGMNNFVYTKNTKYAQKFTLDEIQKISQDLTSMFHNRDSYATLAIDLEQFILGL